MKRASTLVLVSLFVLLFAPAVFAQEEGEAGAGVAAINWVAITSGFAMAIASAVCGVAQGRAIASALEGMARNPGAAGPIRIALLIGLAFIESLALYTLVIVFFKVV